MLLLLQTIIYQKLNFGSNRRKLNSIVVLVMIEYRDEIILGFLFIRQREYNRCLKIVSVETARLFL